MGITPRDVDPDTWARLQAALASGSATEGKPAVLPGVTAAATEDEFNRDVVDLAESLGWRVAHFRPAQTGKGKWVTAMRGKRAKGYPDLTMVRGGRLVFAELKRKPNAPTAEQLNWLEELQAAGAEAYLWWTTDMPAIVEVLT